MRRLVIGLCLAALWVRSAVCGTPDSLDDRHGSPPLLETLLQLDLELLGITNIERARARAGELTARLATCRAEYEDPDRTADCYLAVLFGEDGMRSAKRASAPEDNSLAAALVDDHGTCAALIAAALALTDHLDAPFEAVVLREHVLLGLAGSPGALFEVLERGRPVQKAEELARYGPLPPGGPVRAGGRGYIPYYLDNLAARFAEAGNAATAEATFRKALSLAPRAPRLHYNFGTFLLDQDRAETALEHLRRATRLGWKDADAYVNRGAALWKLGRLKQATRSFAKALELDRGNARARENLRRLRQGAARADPVSALPAIQVPRHHGSLPMPGL